MTKRCTRCGFELIERVEGSSLYFCVNPACARGREEQAPSLRDRFAMAALTGIMASLPQGPPAGADDKIAAIADEIADAMMRRRKEST